MGTGIDGRSTVPQPAGETAPERSRAAARGRVLAAALELLALVAAVGLLARGDTLARPALLLGLVAVVALCTNRDALWSSELAATGEAAAFLCAVVLFRDDSPFLAPLLLGLVSGWLDRYHWRSRAFVRMTFNSGNRALACLAAAGALAAATAAGDGSVLTDAVATVAACAAFVIVDSGMLVVLVVVARLAGSMGGAVRDVARLDAWSLPLAAYGAVIGFALGAAPWWIAPAALVPAAFVPERVLAHAARSPVAAARCRLLATFVGTVVVTAAVALVLDASAGDTVAAAGVVVVLAVGLGLELAYPRATAVPPLTCAVAVVAVAAVAGPGGTALAVGAVLVAVVVATATTTPRSRVLVVAPAGCVAAALAGLAFGVVDPASDSSAAVVATALGSAVAFELVVIASTPTPRAGRGMAALWTAPVVLAVVVVTALVAVGEPDLVVGSAGAGALVVAIALVRLSGSPPWPGGRSARPVAGAHVTLQPALLMGVGALGTGCGVASAVVGGGTATWLVVIASVLVEVDVAMALAGVRQWRLSPASRRRDASALLTAALVVALAVPALAAWSAGAGAAAIAVSAGVAVLVGRRPAALSAAAALLPPSADAAVPRPERRP